MTPFIEKPLFREGILKPGPFAQNYDLHCYLPSDVIAPFVEHYFISRRRTDFDPAYIGNDVLSQPVVSLFFKPEGAYIEGPTTQKRTLVAKDSPIYVGAQFKPGGFHPFWNQSVRKLAETTVPAATVFPTVNNEFTASLLSYEDNQQVLALIESLLTVKKPRADPIIRLVNDIILFTEEKNGMATVAETAAHFGKSERSIQHLFQTYVGVGLKWAIMRVRFLGVIKYARQQQNPDWTMIASEFGYSDQSHFINDFKHLVGKAPSQYMKEMPS
jgi:AraC-like DNA-binding protein